MTAVTEAIPDKAETLALAFEAAKERLKQQDTTLGNLRNRATGLFAAATVATSVAAAVGVWDAKSTTNVPLPPWSSWSILLLILTISVAVFHVLWPANPWEWGASPEKIWELRAEGPEVVHSLMLPKLISAIQTNDSHLKSRFDAYRIGVGLVMVELLVFVLAVAIS